MPLLFAAPKDLERHEVSILLLMGAAFFIGHYDITLLTLALPDVQASFSIAEEDLGKLIAFSRLGALPALALALMADRLGRRRLLIATLVGLSVASLATSTAQSATQFMLYQSVTRLFITLEEILAVVYVLEMLSARHRGWGIGTLIAMGGLGAGFASVLYGAVNFLPGGWRALYIVGAVAILLVAWLRRGLPESTMFLDQAKTPSRQSILQPLQEIFTFHRTAIVALLAISAMFWFQASAGLNFMSKFLQDSHGYSPGQVSLLFVLAGTVVIFGNILAGRVSDVVGRRPVLAFGLLLNCCSFLAFYSNSGILVPLAWIGVLLSSFIVDVMVFTIAGELFPTSCRSTASTLRSVIGIMASVMGLVAEGYLYTLYGSHATALSFMTLTSLLGLPVVVLWLRETANTRLD